MAAATTGGAKLLGPIFGRCLTPGRLGGGYWLPLNWKLASRFVQERVDTPYCEEPS
jgi:hypothetical protein